MLQIFHGDNIAASRTAFLQKKEGIEAPLSLRGGEFTITDLAQIFQGGSLFAETKSVYIEDLFGRVKKQEDLDAIAATLLEEAKTHQVFLWESKQLTPKQLGLLKGATPFLFKLPSTLFAFLDQLSPDAIPSLLKIAGRTMADAGEEVLFAMLIRQIRLLLALKVDASIDEVKRLAPWQKGKLQQQAAKFSTDQLLSLYQELFAIDRDRKTGNLPVSLGTSIDFLLLRLYH